MKDERKMIFVFGSNQMGRHGKGAALCARNEHQAYYGVGEGRTGNAFAIPTKGYDMKPRTLDQIELSVRRFLEYAREHPELRFNVTRIGCGLAGYKNSQIAPMFKKLPDNCYVHPYWVKHI
jgi:hypothetical protein